MYTEDKWLSARGVRIFFLIILLSVIAGTLSSCSNEESVYFLYITDYDEESYSVEIREYIGDKETIVCVLDRYLDSHPDSERVVEALDTQIGFDSPYTASIAYWNLIEQD